MNLITSFWGHSITFTNESSLENRKLRVCVLKAGVLIRRKVPSDVTGEIKPLILKQES